MSYITSIQTAVPAYAYPQEVIIGFYQTITDDAYVQRKIKVAGQKSGIQTRYSVLPDFDKTTRQFPFFEPTAAREYSLSARMTCYRDNALPLCVAAIQKIPHWEQLQPTITHLITVSCTGMYAPGLDIDIIKTLGLPPTTRRTAVNFMGCNAAVLGLHQADAICRSEPSAKVVVVCVELCTLHFQHDSTDDYILSTSIFGDGCAAVLVEATPTPMPTPALRLTQFFSYILHEGRHDMAWQLSESGFIMQLSAYVSSLINGQMPQLLAGLPIENKDTVQWAIHPGGKKILDEFCKTMQLRPEQLHASYEVLKNYGNMSSPTVLFVLKQLMEQTPAAGTQVVCAAFGPGLTIETFMATYV